MHGTRRPRAALAPAVLVGAVVCAALALAIAARPSDEAAPSLRIAARVTVTGAGRAAVGRERLWVVDPTGRRVHILDARSGAPLGRPLRVGSAPEVATDVVARGPTAWVALARPGGGGGHVVRIGAANDRRAVSTADLVPRRLIIAPGGAVAVLGDARLAVISPRGRRRWERRLPSAVDVAIDRGVVWTLSRTAGGSRLDRWSLRSGRHGGARTLTGAGTAVSAARGVVWVADGCIRGVIQMRADLRTGRCRALGHGSADVDAFPGGAWVAESDGRRVVRLLSRGGAADAALPAPPVAISAGDAGAWVVERSGHLTRVTAP